MAALPALILADPATAGRRVAALTLLDRLLVTLHRAGCGPITVVSAGPLPELRRAPALGVKFALAAVPPARLGGAALVAETGLLTNVPDVRRVLDAGGRLVTAAGAPLPLAVLPAGARPGEAREARPALPALAAAGVACAVTDAASARAAERALWASLTSASDGFVDRWFNRPAGRPFARLLLATRVTPNQVSVLSILVGLAGALCFAAGTWEASVAGALLFQLSAVIDCMDGDVARAVFKESALGKWLDLAGDQVVHAAVFVGIAAGLGRTGSAAPVLWLAVSCVAGAAAAFAVVLRGLLRPDLKVEGRMQRLMDATTSRDFSVLVLALALAGRLEWFLWLAAAGAHAFWVAALGLQLRARRAAA